jgi:ribosome biogenesis GTPase
MHLESIGWRPSFAAHLAQFPNHTAARVAKVSRDSFLLWTATGELEAQPSGQCRKSTTIWPTTGDWVALSPEGQIEAVLPRQTALIRKQPGKTSAEHVLAANLDVLFIVTSLDHDFNIRRIERYLILARQGGIQPVLILNKADLHENPSLAVEEANQVCAGSPILLMSAAQNWGFDQIHQHVQPGQTAALAGSSGVGKSTLLNRLLGAQIQPTQAVREHDQRGRHTTTTRELFALSPGWLLIDMPGIREIQLPGGTTSIEEVFDDILALSAGCRFRNCLHQEEPGCAVKTNIAPARLEAYRKLLQESAHEDRRTNTAAALAEKQRSKLIHKQMRSYFKR